jgi:ketosteroid isomerase-like protein
MTDTSSARTVVTSWVQAANAADTAALRALYERGAIISDSGQSIGGIDAIMRWSTGHLIAPGTRITINRIDLDARGAVLYSYLDSSDRSGAARVTFTVENGLIRRVDL